MLVNVAVGESVERYEVPREEILSFHRGILGFEDHREYALFSLDRPFLLLQSVEDPYLGFVVISPFLVDSGYQPTQASETLPRFGVLDANHLEWLAIVTLGRDGSPVSANLRAPIAVNPRTRAAAQLLLQDSTFSICHPIRISSPEEEWVVEAHPCEGPGKGDSPADAGTGGSQC